MTEEKITELINTADALTATLTVNAAALPADINTNAALAEALKALGIAVTSRLRETGRGSTWHPGLK